MPTRPAYFMGQVLKFKTLNFSMLKAKKRNQYTKQAGGNCLPNQIRGKTEMIDVGVIKD